MTAKLETNLKTMMKKYMCFCLLSTSLVVEECVVVVFYYSWSKFGLLKLSVEKMSMNSDYKGSFSLPTSVPVAKTRIGSPGFCVMVKILRRLWIFVNHKNCRYSVFPGGRCSIVIHIKTSTKTTTISISKRDQTHFLHFSGNWISLRSVALKSELDRFLSNQVITVQSHNDSERRGRGQCLLKAIVQVTMKKFSFSEKYQWKYCTQKISLYPTLF